jgi:hypothetical protein
MFFSAAVLQGLNDLRNKNPKIVEVTKEELIAAMKRQGSKDWEINMTLTFLEGGAALGGSNGERIVIKKEDNKED